MSKYLSTRRSPIFLSLICIAALTACGGSGGFESTSALDVQASQSGNAIVVDCTNCGATSPTTFTAGTTAGVWKFVNQSDGPATAQVAISGLSGQEVFMTISNPTEADISMPREGNYRTDAPVRSISTSVSSTEEDTHHHTEGEMLKFNAQGFKNYLNKNSSSAKEGLALKRILKSTTGDTRRWTDCLDVDFSICNSVDNGRDTTLVEQRLAQDGRVVNFWVENTERAAGKITDQMVGELIAAYINPLGIHDSIKSLGGEPWGTTLYPAQLIADNQQIDIVIANLTPDGSAGGTQGYNFSGNNFLSSVFPPSNEAVVIFLDSEAAYLSSDLTVSKTTLAHEATHMTSFFRRSATRSTPAPFEVWLEETTAIAAEDITANRLTPGFNPVRDERLLDYLFTRSGNCSLTNFQLTTGTCFGYDVNGVFAGYLVRQLGVDFYKSLLNSPRTDSLTALDEAIKTFRPASSLGRELQSWAQVTFAGTPNSDLPPGFGYRSVPIGISGFDLPEIDLVSIGGISRFSSSSPVAVRSLASISWRRSGVIGTFSENVIVPAGTTLSITINN